MNIIDKLNEIYDKATAKVEIILSKSSITLNRGNEWTDKITISNYEKLKNVRIQTGWIGDAKLNTAISSSGIITITTKDNFKENWDLAEFKDDYCQIAADNSESDAKITISSESEGRIGVACNNYTFGLFYTSQGYSNNCGSIEFRLTSGVTPYINQTLEHGKLVVKGNIIEPNSKGPNDEIPPETGECNVWWDYKNITYTTATIKINKSKSQAYTCPVNDCKF